MTNGRHDILEMLSAGKITADEAERLIAALEREPSANFGASTSELNAKPKPKYLRVLIQDGKGSHGSPVNVNVRVPMQLLRAGVKLAGLIPAPALSKANVALGDQGIHIDLSAIKPENLDDLVDQLSDLTVDLNETDGTKVRVFCE